MDRDRVLARYRELVLHELPRRARAERWVVTADHCFGRIVLDHAVGGRWYDHLDRRRSPAFAQLDDERLATPAAWPGGAGPGRREAVPPGRRPGR